MFKLDRERAAKDTAYREEMKLRCQTDLLFLGRLLGYHKLDDVVHGPVVDLYVKKNPALTIEQQSDRKESLQLDPRGIFKSTLDMVDTVQWVICFANAAICHLTATKPLAVAIVGEITDHFVKAPLAEPTDFQFLFPDFCITPKERRVGEFTAPCRTVNRKEATVMAFSNETTISGWHFDVWKPDDVVDTQNSKTAPSIALQKKNYRINRKTLMPWGYEHAKGTRYDAFDLWGDKIEKARPGIDKVLIRSALTLKNGVRLEPGEFPAESEMVLLFPQLLNYAHLKKEFDDDYDSFMTQYMNDAHGGKEIIFSREAMLSATLEAEKVPVTGQIVIAGRFNYSAIPAMKYAGFTVGMLEGGRMWIIDILRGVFKPSALAHAIAQLAKTHGVHQVTIEDTPGARYYESAITNYALTLGWKLNIAWTDYQEDAAVRDLRMKGTEPLIASRRLVFSASLDCLKQVFRQFCTYGMVEESEIPDSVSRVCEALPASILTADLDREQELAWELARQRDMYDRTHGIGKFAPPLPAETPHAPPSNPYGLEDIMPGLNG